MKDFWNERYGNTDYAYGKAPNVFFAKTLKKLSSGTLILPCEGEGRNAVFAAKSGWQTLAFDYSEEAKVKALQLAKEMDVQINYVVQDVLKADFKKNDADAVAFIYAHFPENTRRQIHQKAIEWLKPGGKIILEAFTPHQLNNASGGPKVPTMLYTPAILQDDFKALQIDLLAEEQMELFEGKFHKGKADIIRMVAIKK